VLKRRSVVALLLVAFIVCACAAAAGPKSARTANAESADAVFKAAVNPEAARESAPKEPPIYIVALGFTGRLLLVLGLAYGTIFALKRFSSMRAATGGSRTTIRVIENSSLGSNKSLHLVEVGSRKLLVASTPNQVNLVVELGSDDVPEDETPPSGGGFKSQLSLFLGHGKTDAAPAARNVAEMLRDSTSVLDDQVRKLRVRHESAQSG